MRTVEVILLKDVERIGAQGAVVHVAPGFARNFLLPQGLAEPATPERLKTIEVVRRQRARKVERAKAEQETLRRKLEAHPLTLTLTVGAEDKPFGAVTAHDVALALGEAGFQVDKRAIRLKEPIKALGTYAVPVRLHPEVTATLQVSVVKGG